MPEREAPARIRELAEALANARDHKDDINDVLKKVQQEHDEAEAALFDAMEDAGLTSIRIARGLFRLNDLAWARVTDETLAREWAEAHAPDLLTLNRQRLSVIVRQIVKEEEDRPVESIPPGVDYTTSRKITWRKP